MIQNTAIIKSRSMDVPLYGAQGWGVILRHSMLYYQPVTNYLSGQDTSSHPGLSQNLHDTNTEQSRSSLGRYDRSHHSCVRRDRPLAGNRESVWMGLEKSKVLLMQIKDIFGWELSHSKGEVCTDCSQRTSHKGADSSECCYFRIICWA